MIYSLDDIDKMEGHDFERLCADLLRMNGYKNVRVTQGSGDYGVDILAKKDDFSVAFQCKRFSNPVGVKAVQEVVSGSVYYQSDVAIVLTNNTFTPQAIDMAKRARVQLWGRDKLIQMVDLHNLKEKKYIEFLEKKKQKTEYEETKQKEDNDRGKYAGTEPISHNEIYSESQSNIEKREQKPINSYLVIAVLIIFPPLGLLSMWIKTNWDIKTKIVVSLIYPELLFFPVGILKAIILFSMIGIAIYWNKEYNQRNDQSS